MQRGFRRLLSILWLLAAAPVAAQVGSLEVTVLDSDGDEPLAGATVTLTSSQGFVALAQWLIPYYVNVYTVSVATAGFLASIYTLPSGVICVSNSSGAYCRLQRRFSLTTPSPGRNCLGVGTIVD